MNLLEEKLGYKFKDPKLLQQALTHTSYSAEHNSMRNNERLEFLGDSVMGLVVSGYLYSHFPEKDEGFLSKLRAAIVSRAAMSAWGAEIKLGLHLRLGAGELANGGRGRLNNLANAIEAVLGAVYLDGGLEAAGQIIISWLESAGRFDLPEDYKSLLQLQVQKRYKTVPSYETLSESGPEHDKTFKVRVYLGRKTLGLGCGKSLKFAQQHAASAAIEYLHMHKLSRKDCGV